MEMSALVNLESHSRSVDQESEFEGPGPAPSELLLSFVMEKIQTPALSTHLFSIFVLSTFVGKQLMMLAT